LAFRSGDSYVIGGGVEHAMIAVVVALVIERAAAT
jgi:hypothetical protein